MKACGPIRIPDLNLKRKQTMLLPKKIIMSFFLLIIFIPFFYPGSALCGQITGKVRVSRAKKVQIFLTVPAPAPKTVILTLRLPEGTKVVSSTPAPARFLPEKREVNWLLADLRPGQQKIECSMNQKIRISDLSVSVRYKNPRTGKMEDHVLAR